MGSNKFLHLWMRSFLMIVLAATTSYAQNGLAMNTKYKDSLVIKVLPFKTSIQWVGHHPYDWNDGAMIPAKGDQQ